jgi:hypothetical protein
MLRLRGKRDVQKGMPNLNPIILTFQSKATLEGIKKTYASEIACIFHKAACGVIDEIAAFCPAGPQPITMTS